MGLKLLPFQDESPFLPLDTWITNKLKLGSDLEKDNLKMKKILDMINESHYPEFHTSILKFFASVSTAGSIYLMSLISLLLSPREPKTLLLCLFGDIS